MTIVIHPDLAQTIVNQWLDERDLTTITRNQHDELTSPELQRRGDLIDELRRQLQAAARIVDDPTITAWRRIGATIPTPTEWNALVAERDEERGRVANLDQLLQQRDRLIETTCPCSPDAPKHEHLTGGYALTEAAADAMLRRLADGGGQP